MVQLFAARCSKLKLKPSFLTPTNFRLSLLGDSDSEGEIRDRKISWEQQFDGYEGKIVEFVKLVSPTQPSGGAWAGSTVDSRRRLKEKTRELNHPS